jgi:hypothetical protein
VPNRRISIDELMALAKRGVYGKEEVERLTEETECPSTSTNVPKVTIGRSIERASRGRKWQKEAVRAARRLKTELEAPDTESLRRSKPE